ncbi:MAG: hypothetical protein IJZ72_06320 [Oscillospiraceae bacterium]|nr:hypothetical protein [Oscillospiraceae bacterium]
MEIRYIFKRIKSVLKPVAFAYLFTVSLFFILFADSMDSTADIVMVISAMTAAFIAAGIAVVVYDHSVYVKNNPDSNLIKDCFKGCSAKSRRFFDAVTDFRQGRPDMALETLGDFGEYKLSQREDALVCFYKAECYRSMGYNTNAAIWYAKAIERELNEDFVYILAARCYVNAGSYSAAMEMYRAAEEKGGAYDCIYTDMGMCFLKWEKPDDAIACFDRSIREGRNYAFALGGYAIACIMKKDVETSREAYKAALVSGLADVKGFIEYYRSVAEAAGCSESIKEFSKLTIDSDDVKE